MAAVKHDQINDSLCLHNQLLTTVDWNKSAKPPPGVHKFV